MTLTTSQTMTPSERFSNSITTAVAISGPLLIFGPLTILSRNFEELKLGYLEVLWRGALPTLLITAILSLALIFLPKVASRTLGILLAGIGIGLYIEGNILDWDYGAFDGQSIEWSEFRSSGYIDIAVWTASIISAIALGIFNLSRLRKLLIFLIALQALGSIVAVFQNSIPAIAKISTPAIAPFFTFAPKKNVVMILLDEFQGPSFHEILRRDPAAQAPFEDFTYYQDTISYFPTTNPSIPSILSGDPYQPPGSLREHFSKSLKNSIPTVLAANGYDTSLVTLDQLCPMIGLQNCISVQNMGMTYPGATAEFSYLSLIDLALFRYVPHHLKGYIFNDNAWFLQAMRSKDPGDQQHILSMQYVDRFEREARVDPEAKATYKFIHLLIPHAPYDREGDCKYTPAKRSGSRVEPFLKTATCALSLTARILDSLKKLGIYDDATIIIQSDHGNSTAVPLIKWKEGLPSSVRRAFALLLIKLPGEKFPELRRSLAPAQLTDIPRTLMEALQIPNSFGGRDIRSLREDEIREREFHFYKWAHKYWYKDELPPVRIFKVKGYSLDLENWEKVEEH